MSLVTSEGEHFRMYLPPPCISSWMIGHVMWTLLRQVGTLQDGFGGRAGSDWEHGSWCHNDPGEAWAGRVTVGAGGTAAAEGGGHQGGQVNPTWGLTADGGEGEGGHGEQPGFWLGQMNRRSHVLRQHAGGYGTHTPPHDASLGELLGTAAKAQPSGVAEKARRQERLTWQAS